MRLHSIQRNIVYLIPIEPSKNIIKQCLISSARLLFKLMLCTSYSDLTQIISISQIWLRYIIDFIRCIICHYPQFASSEKKHKSNELQCLSIGELFKQTLWFTIWLSRLDKTLFTTRTILSCIIYSEINLKTLSTNSSCSSLKVKVPGSQL